MIKISALFRFMRVSWVLVREGVIEAFQADDLEGWLAFGYKVARFFSRRKNKNNTRQERISNAINKLGPFYIKLGQFLATRPDIVGHRMANDLSFLQDRVAPFSSQVAVTQIEKTLGRNIGDLFIEFSKEPIAAASIAQVHPAKIKNLDGTFRRVAVKVIRPGLRQAFARDMNSFFWAAKIAERYSSLMQRLRLVHVIEHLRQVSRLEMDMRLEAAALSEMAENTAQDKGFRVPTVEWAYTGRDVLTMEWIDGTKISNLCDLKDSGCDLRNLAVILMQSFLRHALRDGFFHADLHPGNLFVNKKKEIVAVDFGIVGRLREKERYFLAEILYGFIYRDYQRIAKVHFEAGYVPSFHDIASFAQANRAIGEPIHGHSVESISMARLLALLFEITEIFDMQTRPELLLLQKTMVVVEGVSRSLDPHFNMWKAAEPIVSEWISKNLGIIGTVKDISNSGKTVLQIARKLSQKVASFDQVIEKLYNISTEGFRLEKNTLQYLTKIQTKRHRSGVYALWLIAMCCFALTCGFFFFLENIQIMSLITKLSVPCLK